MSLQSWKDEFYPVRAVDVPAEKALDHSIQKWEGLLPKNLHRHGVVFKEGALVDDVGKVRLAINSLSCALCMRYPGCSKCPLAVGRGGVPCDQATPGEESPWLIFIEQGDPVPMLEELERTKDEGWDQ